MAQVTPGMRREFGLSGVPVVLAEKPTDIALTCASAERLATGRPEICPLGWIRLRGSHWAARIAGMVQRHDDPRGEPNWQPVTAVTMMAGMLTEQLAANREQLELLGRARREPWLLDDATVDRVKKVFGVQRDDMWLWEENGRRWQALDLDTATRAQAGGYMSLAAQFAATSTEVLALAGEIAGGTISKVMAKSDLELGIEALHRDGPI
jgi:hypothetical protein